MTRWTASSRRLSSAVDRIDQERHVVVDDLHDCMRRARRIAGGDPRLARPSLRAMRPKLGRCLGERRGAAIFDIAAGDVSVEQAVKGLLVLALEQICRVFDQPVFYAKLASHPGKSARRSVHRPFLRRRFSPVRAVYSTSLIVRPNANVTAKRMVPAPPMAMRTPISDISINWSGRWDLNPRPSRWQRDALPLSYSRAPRGQVPPIGGPPARARILAGDGRLFKALSQRNRRR